MCRLVREGQNGICVFCVVLDVEPEHAALDEPARRVSRVRSGSSAESVRLYRARTDNAYGKAYAKARATAVTALIAQYPQDFAVLLEKARVNSGLGPTRRA